MECYRSPRDACTSECNESPILFALRVEYGIGIKKFDALRTNYFFFRKMHYFNLGFDAAFRKKTTN